MYNEQTISAKIANPSSNSQYDVFLHYHNDISHSMFQYDGYQGHGSMKPQMVDLKILPD